MMTQKNSFDSYKPETEEDDLWSAFDTSFNLDGSKRKEDILKQITSYIKIDMIEDTFTSTAFKFTKEKKVSEIHQKTINETPKKEFKKKKKKIKTIVPINSTQSITKTIPNEPKYEPK